MKMRKMRSSTPRTGARVSAGNTEEFIEPQGRLQNSRQPLYPGRPDFPVGQCRHRGSGGHHRPGSPAASCLCSFKVGSVFLANSAKSTSADLEAPSNRAMAFV